jgi:gluconokinase
MTTTIVVMGVSGSGKSTVAAELVSRTGWVFAEGDAFHPAANVARMHAGVALTDDDRWPWLEALAGWIGEQEAAGLDAVVTCSALKRSYRDLLRAGHPSVWFAHIDVPARVLTDRLEHRAGHYMPLSLLGSQLATLEPLQPDEPGTVVEAQRTPAEVAAAILDQLPGWSQLSRPGE